MGRISESTLERKTLERNVIFYYSICEVRKMISGAWLRPLNPKMKAEMESSME